MSQFWRCAVWFCRSTLPADGTAHIQTWPELLALHKIILLQLKEKFIGGEIRYARIWLRDWQFYVLRFARTLNKNNSTIFTFSEEKKKVGFASCGAISRCSMSKKPMFEPLCSEIFKVLFHLGHKVHSRVLAATCLYLIWLHR